MSAVHRDNNELDEKSHLNDVEGAGVGGIDVVDDDDMPITSDLHYYVWQAATSTSERTKDAKKISEPKDDEKNIARRRKLTLLPFRRIGVFLMIICLVAIGTVLGVTFSPKNSDNSSSNCSSSIEEDEDINGGPISITTEVPIEENNITVDELEEEDNNINSNPNNSGDDDEDGGTRLVVIEVKEHRLSSVEIAAAQNNVALEKRGAIEDGNRKLKRTPISSLCDPPVYYDSIRLPSSLDTKYDVSSWTREMLQPLLEETQRSLPYTDKDGDDVWKALQDIDRGIDVGSVRLIYSQKDVPSEPKGTFDTWNREHTWPKSLGVGKSGPDFTDIHHLFPSDASVNTARSNRYFDTCTDQSVCRPPSALQDNEKINGDDVALFGGDVFQPPIGVRGDIARAIFYMDLRYPHLELTDCPNNEDPKNQMAYLSTLLTWHELDPPTEMERLRNDRVCSRWQGNRNPFVDYPDLATKIYGSPHKESDRSCNSNNDHNDDKEKETQPPKKLPIPGDVMITAVYSDNPDKVELVTLVDLPSGLTIHMTDNAYNGNSLASNEGTISLTLPNKVLAGTVFGYGEGLLYGSSWISEIDKGFALSASGDTLIVYYTTIPNGTDNTYLSALSYSGAFKGSGEKYGTSSSTLPESIVKFSVALRHKDNFVYIGPTGYDIKESLQTNLVDTRNWEGSNTKSSLSSTPPQGFSIIEPR
jgi:endonuclease I